MSNEFGLVLAAIDGFVLGWLVALVMLSSRIAYRRDRANQYLADRDQLVTEKLGLEGDVQAVQQSQVVVDAKRRGGDS